MLNSYWLVHHGCPIKVEEQATYERMFYEAQEKAEAEAETKAKATGEQPSWQLPNIPEPVLDCTRHKAAQR